VFYIYGYQPEFRDQDVMSLVNPLISVITPAYRAENTILRAVESVIAQTYSQWEMLIVSDDGIDYQSILADRGIADPRLRYFTTGRVGAGPNLARNIALDVASGEYIAPLDADDLFYPRRLERLLPLAIKHGMSGDNLAIVDATTHSPVRLFRPEKYAIYWFGLPTYARTLIPLIFLFRRDVIARPWDVDVELGADTLFNLRAMERVGRVPFVESVLHEYHIMAESVCHASTAHEKAERAYTHCLEQLQSNGMGLETPQGMQITNEMLLRKRAINRRYAQTLEAGLCSNFQQFIATCSNLEPTGLSRSLAMTS
jgi:glycosyltransferase involved in cell wall biosynthesis